MAEANDPKVVRTRMLDAIYDKLKDDTASYVSLWDIRDELGLSDERAANAASYLEGEGLIKVRPTAGGQRTPHFAHITHHGVKAMEAARDEPEQSAATGLAPYGNIYHVTIHASPGSAFQIGNVSSTQTNRISSSGSGDDSELRKLLAEIESKMPELRQALGEKAAELESDAEFVKGEIDLPKRRTHLIKASLQNIGVILQGAGGNLAATGILNLLHQIHL